MPKRHENQWTRRRVLQGLTAAGAVSAAGLPGVARFSNAAADEDLLGLVNIFWGTGGHGHTYPGATVPFGMVQLSPDTYNDDWDWCSGYHASDSTIMGFSHTHLSGTGCGDLLDFLVVPRTGEVRLVPGDRKQPGTGYRSSFSHADEKAHPGYYSDGSDDQEYESGDFQPELMEHTPEVLTGGAHTGHQRCAYPATLQQIGGRAVEQPDFFHPLAEDHLPLTVSRF